MTIHNMEAYTKNLWDWGFLDECFGATRIRLTDIDGIVERNGHFLIIEAKSLGKEIPTGQKIMFDHLTKNPNWTVLIIWGDAPDEPTTCMVWGKPKQYIATREVIKTIVSQWFKDSNAR